MRHKIEPVKSTNFKAKTRIEQQKNPNKNQKTPTFYTVLTVWHTGLDWAPKEGSGGDACEIGILCYYAMEAH